MMNTSIKTFQFLILFGVISCSNSEKKSNSKVIEDTYRPTLSSKKITEYLDFAYKGKTWDLLDNIFVEWHQNVGSNSVEFINQNDTISAIFEIFNTFYKPNEFLKFGSWEHPNTVKSKYIVIQNTILYSILKSKNIDKVNGINSRRTLLSNFRPPISSGNNNILYLTEEYAESFNIFLRPEAKPAGEIEEGEPSGYRVKSQRKAELLKSYIPVNYDYLEHYWHLETHPYINVIFFNKSLTKAKIDFYVGQLGGEAILEKKENGWFIKQIKSNLED